MFVSTNDGSGSYYMICAANGGTLQIPENFSKQGSQCHVSQPNKTPNEKWFIKPAYGQMAGKGFIIKSALSGLALDLNGGNLQNENAIIIW